MEDDRKHDGIGEGLFYRLVPTTRITSVFVQNGYNASEKLWSQNSRVKKLEYTVIFSDGSKAKGSAILPDTRDIVFFRVGAAKSESAHVDAMEFVIRSVYKGTAYSDTCISLLAPW